MRGDFTRNTFDPARNFSRVLMQQGRVTLDADWNEQASILLHFMRTFVVDLIGPAAGPLGRAGFELISAFAGKWQDKVAALVPPDQATTIEGKIEKSSDVLIAPGRYYVEGLPAVIDKPLLYSAQRGYSYFGSPTLEVLANATTPYLFYLDVWEQHVTALECDEVRDVALGGPDTCTRAKVHWQVRAVVQPPNFSSANTAATSKAPAAPAPAAAAPAAPPADDKPVFACDYVRYLPRLGTGALRAGARCDKPPTELCVIPPESRYRGTENQLYRVEIHRSGVGAPWPGSTPGKTQQKSNPPTPQDGTSTPDIASFKWSREDGSVVFALQSLAETTAIVTFLGRDRRLGLDNGDLVEVMDDDMAAAGVSGPLAQVQAVDRDHMMVTLQFAKTTPTPPGYTSDDMDRLHPRLIRWDKVGNMSGDGALAVLEPGDNSDFKSGWIELEDGVQIRFDNNSGKDANGNDKPPRQYLAGDYWLIPARTITGDVDWPHAFKADGTPVTDGDGNPVGAALQARGVHHYYAPLLLVTPGTDDAKTTARDCRCQIMPLTCV
jgi:hypothetical protein